MNSSTPVSAVIKVCALDAPYLEVVVPHMIRQAHYPFAEVVLVADPRTSFTGKYRQRAGCDRSELEQILGRLEARGVVSRVVWAEPSPSDVCATLARYFGENVRPEWSHDRTGAPIYSALLGLDVARHDHVLLMDADMLFYSSGASWVGEGVAKLAQVPALWLMMTNAGPPAGPMGTAESLDARNRQAACWDSEHGVWRFRHATSRYFLTDRRRLRSAVPAVEAEDGVEPLEVCLSAALERSAAYRANLALEGSWDLHVHDHGPPFPVWADKIVALVERGVVPRHQRGNYDLCLSREAHRIPWRALLRREFADFNPLAV